MGRGGVAAPSLHYTCLLMPSKTTRTVRALENDEAVSGSLGKVLLGSRARCCQSALEFGGGLKGRTILIHS